MLAELYKVYSRSMEWTVVSLFSLTVLSALLGVISRNFHFIPTLSWTEELTRYSAISCVFLAAGIGVKQGVHIGVTIVLDKLPPHLSKVLHTINCTLLILFMIVIAYAGFIMVMNNMSQTSVSLGLPMGVPFLSIPIGAILVIIELVRSLFVQIGGEIN